MQGRVVLDAGRRAKYLYFPLDKGALVAHLRMTGNLKIEATEEPAERVPTAVFSLSTGGEMRFYDRRRLGKLWLVEDVEPLFAGLGPEPLGPDFTADWLKDKLSSRNAPIKPLLMEQDIAAGVGNIYADEALFGARLYPLRSAHGVGPRKARDLHGAIQSVLRNAIAAGGTSIRDYRDSRGEQGDFQRQIQIYGRAGEPCVACGTSVRRVLVAQRSTHFCPRCQRR
jgi:formamidopyrimidine-DNA glycosylase